MMRVWTVVVALAGCAQLAPEPADREARLDREAEQASDRDGLAPPEVVLSVASDASRRAPIAGAAVLIDRDGAIERLATDDDGIARFAAAGVRACHVVYQSEDDGVWHVATITACRGAIQLGGIDASHEPRRAMTFELPARDGATDYRIDGPSRCGEWPSSTSPTMTIAYRAVCEGERVHLLACATLDTDERCLDAGEVTLRDGRSRVIAGTYRARPTVDLAVSNLPVDLRSLSVDRLARSADDVTRAVDGVSVTSPGTAVHLAAPVVRGSNQLWLVATREVNGFRSSTELVAPVAPDATAVDAAALLAPIYDLAIDHNVMRWGGADGGTIIATQASGSARGGYVQWVAYTDAAATSVAFPALPDDLADATPTRWTLAHMAKLDVPGATLRQLMTTIDRLWWQWPEHPKLSPVAGSRRAQASHFF